MSIRNRILAWGLAGTLSLATPMVAHFEGLRLKAYLDPVGIPTACYGATAGIRLGMVFTESECDARLKADLTAAILAVDRNTSVALAFEQRAAFGSFVYNVGEGAFRRSTLLKILNTGDIRGACNQLPRWIYAGGRKLKGLVDRREAEKNLCLRGLK
jgi:lysozyme